MHSHVGIVEGSNNTTLKLPRNTRVRRHAAPKFSDSLHWNQLAAKYLSQYNLPEWDKPCDLEGMRCWLARLDLTEKRYEKLTATSLAEFIDLNPNWPLRAWIGLILEVTEEGAQAQAGLRTDEGRGGYG